MRRHIAATKAQLEASLAAEPTGKGLKPPRGKPRRS
jgi:hypothetical protein